MSREMARRIANLEEAVAALQTESRLGNSSIEDGTLEALDADGIVKALLGKQDDGSYGVQGANGGKVIADTARPGSITETEIGEGSITTPKLAANAVTAEKLAAIIVLASKFVAGDPEGRRVVYDETGITGFITVGEQEIASWRFSVDGDDFAEYRNSLGEIVAAITDKGDLVARDVTANGTLFMDGRDMRDHLKDQASGLIARGEIDHSAGPIASEFGLMEVRVQVPEGTGASQQIHCAVEFDSHGTGGTVDFRVRDGQSNSPTINDGVLALRRKQTNAGLQWTDFEIWTGFQPGTEHRLLLTAACPFAHTIGLRAAKMFVYQEGRFHEDQGIINNGGGTLDGGGGGGGNEPPPQKTYTTTWSPEWTSTYNGAGNQINNGLTQGDSPFSQHGNQRALIDFGGPASGGDEQGQTIAQALSGATVEWAEVRLRCTHTHFTDGGTAIVGISDYENDPQVWGDGRVNQDLSRWHFNRGQTRWLRLPASIVNNIEQLWTCIALGPGGSGVAEHYCVFDAFGTDGPRLRIRYTR